MKQSMTPGPDTQLEKAIDEALRSGDVRALDVFLQSGAGDASPVNCSQQFLTKLDKLVRRSMDQKDHKAASLGFAVFYKCGKNLKLPGGQGIPGLMAKGLLKKWFETCRQLWIQRGPQWDESLFNLSEDFFDALLVVHGSCEEGTNKITESFLYPIGQLAVDPRIYILIQKEAIRKFNVILDKIPATLKKKTKILTSQEASDIMIKLAGQILEGGDFDFQTALMEALCRMATSNQRKELADQWFSMEHVASAFVKIRDSEFETDCRKFLNLVNGMQGDKRRCPRSDTCRKHLQRRRQNIIELQRSPLYCRVYSYPCLEAYLDTHELLMPVDEKLEVFWIDFNLCSRSISFYFSLADGEAQWETICITENEVKSYSVTEKGKRCILQLTLLEVVIVRSVEGSNLTIHFSSSLDILQAARSVYGHSKNIGFVGKMSTSVVKTIVRIQMEETNSQVVPESQMSLDEKRENPAYDPLPAPPASVQAVTPARMKMSESNTISSCSTGGRRNGVGSISAMKASKGKGKPALEMVHSCCSTGDSDRGELRTTANAWNHGTTAAGMTKQNAPEAKTVDVPLAGQEKESSRECTYVPDTQPSSGRNTCTSWSRQSISDKLVMPPQKTNYPPRPAPSLSVSQQREGQSSEHRSSVPILPPINQKQLHSEVTQRLQRLISERNQNPSLQDPCEPQRKAPDSREDFMDSSDLRTPKEQTGVPTNRKNKGQASLKVDVGPIKASAQVSTTKPLKKRVPPSIKAEMNRALSSKEKRDAELAGNMVKSIASRYDATPKDAAESVPNSRTTPAVNRPTFKMTWLSTAKRDGAGSAMRFPSKIVTTSSRQGEDVFTFKAVSPLSTGGKDRTFNNTSATLSSGIRGASALLNATKKGQPVAKKKRHVKKHLFSDTDTDYAVTEVSWVKESSRRAKPQVAKYSRQVADKPKARLTQASYDAINSTRSTEEPVESKIQPNRNKPAGTERARRPKTTAAAPNRPHTASRRPQRALATYTKTYREKDTDDSLSESDTPSVCKSSSSHYAENADTTHEAARATKRKAGPKTATENYTKRTNEKALSEAPQVKKRTSSTSSEQPTDTHRKLNSKKELHLKKPSGLKRRPETVVAETSKFKKRARSPTQEQKNALTDPLGACQTSCPSTPYAECMRSAERPKSSCSLSLTPRGSPLPASPGPSCQDTPSPIPLLPKRRSAGGGQGKVKAICGAGGKRKSQFIEASPACPTLTPVGKAEVSPIHRSQPSPPLSSLPSPPPLTSTLLDLSRPSVSSPHESTFADDTVNHGSSHFGFEKVSSVSRLSLSQSTTRSSVHICTFDYSPTAAAPATTAEKSPSSNRDLKLVSGPRRKRRVSPSSDFKEANEEEEEEEEEEKKKKRSKTRGQRCPRMKPRKLFMSFADEASAKSEVSQMMRSCYWEDEEGDGDVDEDMDEDMDFEEESELPKVHATPSKLCQQFSSELKERFESRCKMTEIYNKQSLKTVQHYASSLNIQVASNRTQRQEQLLEVLLEEIGKLEQNESLLKSMEKDLMLHAKKQSVSFCSYSELESRRNETLTKAFQSNVRHSMEYEERLFTSQMCLIRKDMKSVQDRLLSQMQVEEIKSVKRGLHALFFP